MLSTVVRPAVISAVASTTRIIDSIDNSFISMIFFSFYRAICYASAVLAMGLCLSVRLSVTSRCSIEAAERIELVFGM